MIDTTQHDFGGRLRPKPDPPTSWENLVDLTNEGQAFVYQRLSTHEQVKRHIWSQEAQDALADLARQDGYPDDFIYVERRDLGISGTKGREERPGLAHLIQQVEAGLVEAVYVVHISRLYRDQTLINALALGELFKEHGVIIVTPHMRLNLRDKMHMRLYRMEVERAADELELMAGRLLGARDLKAKAGRYGGESLPAGYILDTRRQLTNGDPNPNHHSYRVYEPHAQIVRKIFQRLTIPGMTPTRVARWCSQQGLAFPYFPPEFDTPPNRKAFLNSRRTSSGWPVTVGKIRNVATNPVYIGWRIWGGEVVGRDILPPIIDEPTFWAVQERFSSEHESRPKQDKDPLPLAGLLHCGNHDLPRKMMYSNRKPATSSLYQCIDHVLKLECTSITAYILDGPIGEAVVSQIALPQLAEQVLGKLTDEYQQAKEQAASYRREMRRLETEVENLRGNLAAGVLSADQVAWVDQAVQQRLARIRELADLESQPIGAAVGRPIPGKADIELVKSFLDNLGDKWPNQPNGLKNAFLRLLLDKVVIRHGPTQITARLLWRVGLEQEILIHRPYASHKCKTAQPWSQTEVDTLRQRYETTPKDQLVAMLPARTWTAIVTKAKQLGLYRPSFRGCSSARRPPFTPEEDQLLRQYYAGEIGPEQVQSTGRTMYSIRERAKKLKLKRHRRATWEWLTNPIIPQPHTPSRRPRPATLSL